MNYYEELEEIKLKFNTILTKNSELNQTQPLNHKLSTTPLINKYTDERWYKTSLLDTFIYAERQYSNENCNELRSNNNKPS